MERTPRTAQAAELTELIFEVFRLHGELIAMGDRMVAPFELTSTRWQVLGLIDETQQPMTVPMIARHLGVSRQAVQRVVNDLKAHGFVTLVPNPHHKSAKLVELTERGAKAAAAADSTYSTWANAVTGDLDSAQLAEARRLLTDLRARCRDYDPDGT